MDDPVFDLAPLGRNEEGLANPADWQYRREEYPRA
jgi:hypothetical protein